MDNDFLRELGRRQNNIDRVLTDHLPSEENDNIVFQAMNYAVKAGGKRIRPVLASCAYELFNGTNDAVLNPFLAAIEFIHTYSLVHDDLPAMDNDEYRRGKKTTHAVYGEAFGILAGDGLLNYAFETALRASDFCENEDEMFRVIDALRILSLKSGVYGMVGGQSKDIASEGKTFEGSDEDKELLEYIHENKTAALIEAALMCGACLAGADRDEIHRMEIAGSDIGHAFQIKDDILDVIGDPDVTGKSMGKDIESGKLTYVSLYGMEEADRVLRIRTEDAIELLTDLGAAEDGFLISLVRNLTEREL